MKVYYNYAYDSNFSTSINLEYKIGSFDRIGGRIHSVIKDSDDKHLFLIDYKNLYVYNIEKGDIIDVKVDQKI